MSIFKIKKREEHTRYYFCGIKILSYRSFTRQIFENQKKIIKKLSMVDDTWRIGNISFYVPNYPHDLIQSCIVDHDKFFEQNALEDLNQYIPEKATILDIGANIGNHSLYWAGIRNAKKIHAFEPMIATFKILQKNIELNSQANTITAHNFGLSNEAIGASVSAFCSSNIGATSLQKNTNGSLQLKRLDDLNLEYEKIDFVKIDVEGHELSALQGMQSTLAKYKPIIFIESFPQNYPEVDAFLRAQDYTLKKKFKAHNFLYVSE